MCSITTHLKTSKWKSTIVMLICWSVIPILFLVLLEATLYCCGYGVSKEAVRIIETERGKVHLFNISNLYQVTDEHSTETFSIPEWKEDKTYRIFVFGGSATHGWGYNGSFVQMLQIMLMRRYPGIRFEIYNLAAAGLNSSIMCTLAHRVMPLNPDAFLIYMGNNEVHGHYGLIEMHGVRRGRVPTPLEIRLHQFSRRSRLIQYFDNLYKTVEKKNLLNSPAHQLRIDDPRLSSVWRNFKRNLLDIFDIASQVETDVFISTLGANVRGWPPYPDIIWDDLTANEKKQFHHHFDKGIELEKQSNWINASEMYDMALEITHTCPSLLYRNATCLWHLGNFTKAREYYEQALELDIFFWVRAKKDFNNTIRAAVDEYNASSLWLVEGQERLQSSSPHGVPGNELFADSCHFRPEGMYVLAEAFFDQMTFRLPLWVKQHEDSNSPVPSLDEIMKLLGMSNMLLAGDLERLINKSKEYGLENVDYLQLELESIRNTPKKIDYEKQMTLIQDIVASGVEDIVLASKFLECLVNVTEPLTSKHWNMLKSLEERYSYDLSYQRQYGELLHLYHKEEELQIVYKRILDRVPSDTQVGLELFSLLLKHGKYEEAQSLHRSLEKYGVAPETLFSKVYEILWDNNIKSIEYLEAYKDKYHLNPMYWCYLSLAYRRSDMGNQAEYACRRAFELDPKQPIALNLLGRIEVSRGNFLEGFSLLEHPLSKKLSITPGIGEFYIEIGNQIYNENNLHKALQLYQKSLCFVDDEFWPQLQAGNILERLGRIKEARKAYENALTANPDSYDAATKIDSIFRGLPVEQEHIGLDFWCSFSKNHPENTLPLYFKALALERAKRPIEACSVYKKLLDMDPGHANALRNLGALIVARGDVSEGIKYLESAANHDYQLAIPIASYCRETGDLFFSQGKHDKALQLYQTALKIVPGDLWPLVRIEDIYIAKDDVETAIRMYKDVLLSNPESSLAATRLHNLFQNSKVNQKESELNFWKSLTEMYPEAAEPRYFTACNLEQQGKYEEAELIYEQLIISHPEFANAWKNLGARMILNGQVNTGVEYMIKAISFNQDLVGPTILTCSELVQRLIDKGKYKKAFFLCEAALDIKPLHIPLILHVAEIYEYMNNYEEARKTYKVVLGIDPNSELAATKIDVLFQRLPENRRNEALNFWKLQTEKHPEAVTPRYYEALFLERSDKQEEAFMCYDDLLSLYPEHAPSLIRIGALSMVRGDVDEGLSYIHEAVSIDGAMTDVAVSRCSEVADYFLTQYEYQTSLRIFYTALSISPSDLGLLACIGEVYEAMNDIEAARKTYEELLWLAPESPITAERLDRIFNLLYNGRGDDMVHFWTSIVKKHPNAITPNYYLAVSYEISGKARRAHLLYTKIQKSAADSNTTVIRSNAFNMLSENIRKGIFRTKGTMPNSFNLFLDSSPCYP